MKKNQDKMIHSYTALQRETGQIREQAGRSCDKYRIIWQSGKNSNTYKITKLSSQDLPACSQFYPVLRCRIYCLLFQVLLDVQANLPETTPEQFPSSVYSTWGCIILSETQIKLSQKCQEKTQVRLLGSSWNQIKQCANCRGGTFR